ncbi:MAG: glycosyltransferase family 2 protein, partial [Candidatus Aenigmatarchaeota archaeon]
MEEEKIDILFPKKYDHIGGEVKEVSTFRMRRFDGSPRPVDSEEGSVIFGPQVILARKEVFEDIGGYDTVYGKKEGYCWMGSSEFPARAAAAGYSLYYWPDLVIDHFIGEYQSNPRKEYWIAHNQVIFNIRNLRFGWIRALGYLFYDTILANLIYWLPRQLLPQMRGAIQGVVDAISPGEFGPCDGFER